MPATMALRKSEFAVALEDSEERRVLRFNWKALPAVVALLVEQFWCKKTGESSASVVEKLKKLTTIKSRGSLKEAMGLLILGCINIME